MLMHQAFYFLFEILSIKSIVYSWTGLIEKIEKEDD